MNKHTKLKGLLDWQLHSQLQVLSYGVGLLENISLVLLILLFFKIDSQFSVIIIR